MSFKGLKESFKLQDGYIHLMNKPGSGIEVDEQAFKDKLFIGDWIRNTCGYPMDQLPAGEDDK